ncbi:MAG: hypothetical protein U5K37_05780 [Natrialbaceae archaeon]|nr:hypothetical protein [Natrialbaceae archaeon]
MPRRRPTGTASPSRRSTFVGLGSDCLDQRHREGVVGASQGTLEVTRGRVWLEDERLVARSDLIDGIVRLPCCLVRRSSHRPLSIEKAINGDAIVRQRHTRGSGFDTDSQSGEIVVLELLIDDRKPLVDRCGLGGCLGDQRINSFAPVPGGFDD